MTYKIRTCETPLKNAMESGKVIAEGHVQLPAIAPGETGKPASLFLLLSGKVMYWS